MQQITPDQISAGIGAPVSAIILAKSFAPAGRPNYDMIIDSGTQLSVWNKIYGQAATAKYICLFLVSLNKYFNVVRPMSMEQMTELSIELSGMTVFKFEDMIAFMEAVKRQRWGIIRDRLDPGLIWQFFREYDQERDEACVRRANRYKEHGESKENTDLKRLSNGTDGLGNALSNIKKTLKNGK